MREIVLDTETTGLSPASGDRVVEIGCVELLNHIPSGRSWHRYVNPERPMPREAFAVHGLSDEFLADKPPFSAIAEEFLCFVEDARLVIHNAPFDMGFLNAELTAAGLGSIPYERAIDTLMLARRRHPGAPAGLDDLCRRYGVDNSRRDKHGALLDAELLAEVYIELIGGRQAALTLVETGPLPGEAALAIRQRPAPLAPRLTADDIAAHRAFVEGLGENALWRRYEEAEREAPAGA